MPYTLSDMAADAVGLLDELGIERAHVIGASMGGMIAQTMAIEHPQRCLSLTSIMSSPGDPRAGKPTPEAMGAPLGAADGAGGLHRRRRGHRGVHLEALLRLSSGRAACRGLYDRAFYPEGAARQLAAVYASGDRTEHSPTWRCRRSSSTGATTR